MSVPFKDGFEKKVRLCNVLAQVFCIFAATNPQHPWKTKSLYTKPIMELNIEATCAKTAQVQTEGNKLCPQTS
jgi:hypothetical protein